MSSPAAAESSRPQTTQNPSAAPATRPSNLPQAGAAAGGDAARADGAGGPLTPGGAVPGSATSGPAGGQGLGAALASDPPSVNGTTNRSNAIDKQIDEDSRKFKRECKILLLGMLYLLVTLCKRHSQGRR